MAKRPFGTVALAESQGIGEELGRAAVDALADGFEQCLEGLAKDNKLVNGAARVSAKLDRDGAIETVALTVSPGDAVKANALLCLAAPTKLLTFPAAEQRDVDRVFVIEAAWGPPQIEGQP